MSEIILNILKGMAIGGANVIPGVSGGTIALITGILERILNAIKNIFSIKSFRLFFTGNFSKWSSYTDFFFVLTLSTGILIAIISLARILKYLFDFYPVYVWAFFFGLVLSSVYYLAVRIQKLSFPVILFFITGSVTAILIVFLKPTAENSNFIYLVMCGVVSASSMILPGISGSFVLLLMGNYELVMIQAVNNANIHILLPVILGGGAGLLVFSYLLSWIFRKFPNHILSLLTGFMLGSLSIIWPWKKTIWKTDHIGKYILSRSGDKIPEKYIWNIPNELNLELIMAISFFILGCFIIIFTEIMNKRKI